MSRHLVLRLRSGRQFVVKERPAGRNATPIAWTDPDTGVTHYFQFAADVDDKTGLDLYEEQPAPSGRAGRE